MPYNLLVLQLVSKRNILFTYLFYTFFSSSSISFDTLVTISWKMDSRDRFYGFSLLFNIFAEKKTYYAGIMLDAPPIVLCSKLCRHNVSDPTAGRLFFSRNSAGAMRRETFALREWDETFWSRLLPYTAIPFLSRFFRTRPPPYHLFALAMTMTIK